MSISVFSHENATTVTGTRAPGRILGRLAALLPRRAYAPGDRCPLHRADRFYPVGGGWVVVCPESGVLHPAKAA